MMIFHLEIQWIRSFFLQTRDLQSRRQQEELSSDLEISVYDIDRNEKSKHYRKLLVKTFSDKSTTNRLVFLF